MARRYCYKDVLPAAAMAAVECSNVVSNTLFKAASSEGLTYYIFLAYTSALSTLVLFSVAFFHIRQAGLPPLNFPLISRLCLAGLIGFLSDLCVYKGLELGNPTLSSAISSLVPAFTFILAVLFRMEKVALRSSSTQAKVIGTIASISGASVIVFYKGPQVLSESLHLTPSTALHQRPLGSPQSNWMIGGLLITAGYLFISLCYIIQAQIMKIYPEEMTVNFILYFLVAILSIPLCLLAISNMSSWSLSSSIVAAVLYTGIFSLCFSSVVHTWGVRIKGPLYVAIFRPLSIVIAAVTSAIFLGDALYLGSVIGALILSAGLYAVLWGKKKEEGMTYDDSVSSFGPLSSTKVSLLQSNNDEET